MTELEELTELVRGLNDVGQIEAVLSSVWLLGQRQMLYGELLQAIAHYNGNTRLAEAYMRGLAHSYKHPEHDSTA